MRVRLVLVDCVALSLQDSCVFYPCCKGCFSKIELHQQDATRCRCSRCGYICLREQVDYRYRLSVRVARDSYMFGVTVFGTCLNPFFGIPASGLQTLVDDLDGPVEASTRSTLLIKAVQDCLIGRRFVFCLKVTDAESGRLLGRPAPSGSTRNDTVQFIASQMILPKAAGLAGCTVISYYQILLQKAAEYEQVSTDSSKTTRAPATILLLTSHHSPASSFIDATLPASILLSQPLQRSQNHDCTLIPTPPWQQSLGLVTSSAEQEEGCSTQDSGEERSSQKDNNTPQHAQRGCVEAHELMKERAPSALLCLESRCCSSHPSIAASPQKKFISQLQAGGIFRNVFVRLTGLGDFAFL
ncbi:hypothetical protein LDENG_00236390 [Lucifuga dentata]|nr:hypothetical protein LDENG_00236390 [Lucifuga dentata]